MSDVSRINPSGGMFAFRGRTRPYGTALQRFSRRVLSVSLYASILAFLVVGLPVILPVTIVADVLTRSKGAFTRAIFFFIVFFAHQMVGIVTAVLIWIFSGIWAGASPVRFYRWHYRLQNAMVYGVIRSSMILFNIKLVVEGDTDFARKPFILFVRHSAMADTLVPLFITHRKDVSLRIVVKRELLWDPYIEIALNSLPNCFVHRNSDNAETDLASVASLMEGLGPQEGIFIYPEGTRFTEAKRDRILQKYKDAGDKPAFDRIKGFRCVLPPRLGGSLALLAHNEIGADAIFCAHAGLENATTFREMPRGALVGKTVYFKFWRVPYEEIPTSEEARKAWFMEQWRLVDDYVASHLEETDAERRVA